MFFGGSPVGSQSSQQAFATHGTAESELVAYCERVCCTSHGKKTAESQPVQPGHLWRQYGGDWFGQWHYMLLLEDKTSAYQGSEPLRTPMQLVPDFGGCYI